MPVPVAPRADLASARAATAERRERSAVARAEAAEIRERSAVLRAEAAEMRERSAVVRAESAASEINALYASTFWRMTWPLRAAAARMPPTPRRFGRRAATALWWAFTGQLLARLRARSNSRHIAPIQPFPAIEPGEQSAAEVPDTYLNWCKFHTPDTGTLELQRRIVAGFSIRPTFSVLVPCFRTPTDVFCDMVQSVQAQSYEQWELCLVVVDTGDDATALLSAAREVTASDPRIRLRVPPGESRHFRQFQRCFGNGCGRLGSPSRSR